MLLLIQISVKAQTTEEETPPPPPEKPVYFEEPKSPFWQNLHYGGNLWLAVYGQFYADVSPMAGIDITDKGTIAGLGGTFIYQGGYRQKGSLAVGPSLFIRQKLFKSFFAHAEYQLINAFENNFYSYDQNIVVNQDRLKRKWEGSPLLGLGLYQGRKGQQGGPYISVLYNFGADIGKGFISPQSLGGNSSPFTLRIGFLK